MSPTRVLVVPGGLLQGVVARVIAEQPDMVLLGELLDYAALPRAVREQQPDCVVAWLGPDALPRELMEAHEARPDVRILGLVNQANDVHLYELRPRHYDAGELGVRRLLELIRTDGGPVRTRDVEGAS